jgi:hypothetical protein
MHDTPVSEMEVHTGAADLGDSQSEATGFQINHVEGAPYTIQQNHIVSIGKCLPSSHNWNVGLE